MAKITISVRRFEYEALKGMLTPHDRIVILSCDSCAKLCNGLGGEQGLNGLADKLAADGFKVIRRELFSVACSPEQLRARLNDEVNRKLCDEADVIIPLMCRLGIENAYKNIPVLRILRVTETLGRGTFSSQRGAILTKPLEDIGFKRENIDGISLAEAADCLGLYPGGF